MWMTWSNDENEYTDTGIYSKTDITTNTNNTNNIYKLDINSSTGLITTPNLKANPPIINSSSNNWELWNDTTSVYEDSGIHSSVEITVYENTPTSFKLQLTSNSGSTVTDNLRGLVTPDVTDKILTSSENGLKAHLSFNNNIPNGVVELIGKNSQVIACIPTGILLSINELVNDLETGGTDKALTAEQGKILNNLIELAQQSGRNRGAVLNAQEPQGTVYTIDTWTIIDGGTGYSIGDSVQYIATASDELDALFVVSETDNGTVTALTKSTGGSFNEDTINDTNITLTTSENGTGLTIHVTLENIPNSILTDITDPRPNDFAAVMHDEGRGGNPYVWVNADRNGDDIFNWIRSYPLDPNERNFTLQPITTTELSNDSVTLTKVSQSIRDSLALADTAVQPNGYADVAFSGDYNDLENTPVVGAVALSNDYESLDNKPDLSNKIDKVSKATQDHIPLLNTIGGIIDSGYTIPDITFSGNYNDLTNLPTLSAVALSNDYESLDNKPDLSTKMDKVASATQDHIAVLNIGGGVIDSGESIQGIIEDYESQIDANTTLIAELTGRVELLESLLSVPIGDDLTTALGQGAKLTLAVETADETAYNSLTPKVDGVWYYWEEED